MNWTKLGALGREEGSTSLFVSQFWGEVGGEAFLNERV
jgi:hypothetical protein